jgi:hypothetical protein
VGEGARPRGRAPLDPGPAGTPCCRRTGRGRGARTRRRREAGCPRHQCGRTCRPGRGRLRRAAVPRRGGAAPGGADATER